MRVGVRVDVRVGVRVGLEGRDGVMAGLEMAVRAEVAAQTDHHSKIKKQVTGRARDRTGGVPPASHRPVWSRRARHRRTDGHGPVGR